jgi:hypothetical protein
MQGRGHQRRGQRWQNSQEPGQGHTRQTPAECEWPDGVIVIIIAIVIIISSSSSISISISISIIIVTVGQTTAAAGAEAGERVGRKARKWDGTCEARSLAL